MQGLTQLGLAVLDLAEAEGRTLRHGAVRVASAVFVLLVAAIVALGGLGMLVWSLFLGFASMEIGANWAALWTGLITLLVSGALLWIAKSMGK